MKQETAVDFLQKIKSIKLCLMAHPDNKINSEFADKISDLEDIEFELEKEQQGYSDEEVLELLKEVRKGSIVTSSINNRTYWEFDIKSEKKWFEQFKNK